MTSLGGGAGQWIEQYPCDGGVNQIWWLYKAQGLYWLWNKGSSGNALPPGGECMLDQNGTEFDGNHLVMYPCESSAGNIYSYPETAEEMVGAPTNPQPDFEIKMDTPGSWCVSDMGNNSTYAPMELFTCNGSPNQAFASVTLANDNGGGW